MMAHSNRIDEYRVGKILNFAPMTHFRFITELIEEKLLGPNTFQISDLSRNSVLWKSKRGIAKKCVSFGVTDFSKIWKILTQKPD